MKQFKKRTLALVLASVVTVVGAFGAENYKNSLMSLKFNAGTGDSANVTLYTKTKYNDTITPIQRSANVFVIMLPDTNSEVEPGIDFGGIAESVDIKTMPYTKSGNGYTKITIKTKNNTKLTASTQLYIKTQQSEPAKITASKNAEENNNEQKNTNTANAESKPSSPVQEKTVSANQQRNSIRSSNGVDQTGSVDINKTIKQFQTNPPQAARTKKIQKNITVEELSKAKKTSNNQELLYIFLGIAFVITTSIFLMLKAKEKLIEITGEKANYDVSDKPKQEPKKQKEKIKATIKNLDKRYSSPVKMPVTSNENAADIPSENDYPEVKEVVDLDELLNEQQQNSKPFQPVISSPQVIEEEKNTALEDFLSSYDFDNEEFIEQDESKEQPNKINEELYNKYINNDNDIQFTKDDIENIETLLDSEISEDSKQYALTPEEAGKRMPLKVLEELVTTYILSQNINFTKEDLEALYKLINVEIDNDFVTDLRTDPTRMQEMQDEIARQKSKPHKTSELLTLNVKDMLPDLSEALKQQGGRRIESEVKPQVVYFSEGYDVSTLKLNMDLPDLSKEINNEEAYKVRPSDDIQYVDTSYEVQKMSIKNELPDLEDMLKHPEKYETPEPKEVKVDEEALLKNIANVSFKPFDDGTRQFEILNDIEAPSVSDMQEEFNKLGDNFEIINSEEEIPAEKVADTNDFETLYDGKYVDLDKDLRKSDETNNKMSVGDPQNSDISVLQELELQVNENNNDNTLDIQDNGTEPDILEPVNSLDESLIEYPNSDITNSETESEAAKLLNKIKNIERQRRSKKNAKKEINNATINKKEQEKVKAPEFCILDNEKYSIINTTYFTDRMGCYLAKNDKGYCIVGFAGDSVFKIRYYEKLNTEKLQSRLSEKLEDGSARYIVRLGIHKFILNVKQNDMEVVMDLC